MKKSLFILIICFMFSFTGCIFNTDDPGNNGGSQNGGNGESKASISKEYWGAWIQMDTGTEYYIDGSCIYKSSSSSKKSSKVQDGISGYSLESENILKKGNLRFFRKGGASRDFSIQVSGFSDSYSRSASSRAASTGKQGITGRRENGNNSSDTETTTSDEDGKTKFTDAVPDDPQTITTEDGTSTTVTPEYDGQDMGTIPIVEKGMYGFKTTYSINGDGQGFCYGNLYKTYSLTLNLNNIGSITCATSTYSISCDDPNLNFISGNLTGNFSSIEPKKAKTLSFSVTYGYLDKEYIDVPIRISITDSKYQRTWNDSVTLRFYKGVVSFKVNSRNFDSNSSATLNGFFIYPDGRAKRFTVQSGTVSTVLIPWSEKDYVMAFSGATASNEMAYSFGFSKTTNLADLSGVWSIDDINAYESNDTVSSAYKITDLSSCIKAYLSAGDIDYYIINNSSIEVGYEPIAYHANVISDSINTTNPYNNKDGKINPGETINMDIRLQNVVSALVEDVTLTLSSESSYITITNPSKSYGAIKGGYYKTQYGTQYYANDTNYKDGAASTYSYGSYSYPYSGTLNEKYGWIFTIDSETPYNTIIPIKLTFSDKTGKEWSETLNITVLKPGIEIVYHANTFSDSVNTTNSYNNKDGKINPGETIYMDIRIHNKGSSRAINVNSKLTTTSPYITLSSSEKSYGSISGNYYKTQYGAQYYANDESYKYGYSSNYSYGSYSYPYSGTLNASYGWSFTVDKNTPYNTVIPFNMEFTDQNGDTWTDSFEITVVKPSIEIVYHANGISDSISDTYTFNNGDGKINPGETISMDIRIQNKGSTMAKDVVSNLTTTSPYIILSSNEKSYGSIKPGYYKTQYGTRNYANDESYKYGYTSSTSYNTTTYPYSGTLKGSWGWTFTVDKDTPADTDIPFEIEFTDNFGEKWTDSFSVKVQKADVAINIIGKSWSDAKSINSNNNEDLGVNPGETINLDIRVRNTGSTAALGLITKLSSESPYISFTDNICAYGKISGGYYKTSNTSSNSTGYSSESSATFSVVSYPGYVFKISEATPPNTVIPIIITTTDNQMNTWTDVYNVTVVEPSMELQFVSYALSDKITSGFLNDGDGIIEPGEKIYLDFCIKNSGTSQSKANTITCESLSPYITFNTNSRSYGKINPGRYQSYTQYSSSSSTYGWELNSISMNPGSYSACIFTVTSDTPVNTEIPLTVKMKDENNVIWEHDFILLVQ